MKARKDVCSLVSMAAACLSSPLSVADPDHLQRTRRPLRHRRHQAVPASVISTAIGRSPGTGPPAEAHRQSACRAAHGPSQRPSTRTPQAEWGPATTPPPLIRLLGTCPLLCRPGWKDRCAPGQRRCPMTVEQISLSRPGPPTPSLRRGSPRRRRRGRGSRRRRQPPSARIVACRRARPRPASL
jgi:hypothetical protein